MQRTFERFFFCFFVFFKAGERIDRPRRTGCKAVYVLVLHFSPENRSEGAVIAWTHKFSPSPRPQIRILNERRMFGNKRGERGGERVWRDIKGRRCQDFFFFSRLGRRAF